MIGFCGIFEIVWNCLMQKRKVLMTLNIKLLCNRESNNNSIKKIFCTMDEAIVKDNKCDIAAISETWLSASDDAVIADLTPPGFAFSAPPQSPPGVEVVSGSCTGTISLYILTN